MKFVKHYLAGLSLAVPVALTGINAQAEEPLAQGLDKFLGGIYAPSQLEDFSHYFNQVVAENSGKWGALVSGNRAPLTVEDYNESWFDNNDWHGGLENSIQFARDNDFPYRFHVLIWGSQQPSFLNGYVDEPETQRMAIEAWFDVLAERYADDFDFLEVVNEPVNDAPDADSSSGVNYIEALGGTGETGWDWIITSFEMARERFPNSQLMINEYNVISGGVINPYTDIIDLLHERELIDAIGFQAHAFSTTGPTETLAANLDRLAEYGLPIYVTEMDIDAPGGNERTQLREYRRVFSLFWEHEAVEGVTLWGFRPGIWREEANLIREDGSERPAVDWLRCYMDGQRHPDSHAGIVPGQEVTVPSNATAGDGYGEILDCYGAHSSPTDGWHVSGGTGQSVLDVTEDGRVTPVAGASFEQSSYTLDVVARMGDSESEPVTVNVVIGGWQDRPPSAELPSGGGSSSGSTGLLFLTLLGLLGLGRWARRA
ncbi:endo-1,4-beta-xylanase [Marinimicrobium alkaliphilum]|uniref:endo-1,4-beta-xylanase n=1 Tax=Marinimicrobium alkaliphilum TaxID=2202654 RepID=UPI000DBACF56|nr:endo-1,4-beta-xylanase [Marinimicrobium alkaliphilum]